VKAESITSMETATPPPSRGYWTWQFVGWGAFATYIASMYLLFAPERNTSVVVAILLFDGLGGPAITHGLRSWIHRHGWLEMSLRQFAPRAIVAAVLAAAALTAGVVVLERAAFSLAAGPAAIWWTLVAFTWAVGVWISAYRGVQARRRRERLELELTVRAREAQLDALRAQLNPHFLFNCLNSVRALIVQDPSRAVSMVTGLSDLLRYALASDRRRVVPLAEELAIVDQYLDLEKIRFEERLTIERAVDDAALRAEVPPMLLQTLVDNAVKHGVAMLPSGGVVRISARVDKAHLDIAVANTGGRNGADQEGFGLRSATERLRLIYQDRASLTLRHDGATTVATLRLPMESA